MGYDAQRLRDALLMRGELLADLTDELWRNAELRRQYRAIREQRTAELQQTLTAAVEIRARCAELMAQAKELSLRTVG